MSRPADPLETVVDQLNALGLPHMAAKLEELYSSSAFLTCDRLDQFAAIVREEYDHKASTKLNGRLKKAHLLGRPEDISLCKNSLDREYAPTGIVEQLSSLSFIKRGYNLLILGPSDSGKSYLAKALGILACSSHKGEYWHCTDLIDALAAMRKYDQPKFLKKMKALSRLDFLILDDFLITALTNEAETGILISLFEARTELSRTTIVCSQRDPKGWRDMLMGDQVKADALAKRAGRNYTVLIQKKS